VLPVLHLRGISTEDFQEALAVLLGKAPQAPFVDSASAAIPTKHSVLPYRDLAPVAQLSGNNRPIIMLTQTAASLKLIFTDT
jgi:hypothetical protein